MERYKVKRIDPFVKEDRDLFRRFYATLMVKEFPDPSERDEVENFLGCLFIQHYHRANPGSKKIFDHYHVNLLIDEMTNRCIGGIIFNYVEKCSCGILEYIVVDQEYRGGGIGKLLHDSMRADLRKDAAAHGTKLLFILAESNFHHILPETRKFFHSEMYRVLHFDYTQPALSEDKEPATDLHLIVTSSLFLKGMYDMNSKILGDAISEYARLAMRIKEPKENPVIKKMLSNLEKHQVIETFPLNTFTVM